MTYAVQGAQIALLPSSRWTGQLRRLALMLIALALAVTLVALEAPAPTQASGSGRTEAQRIVSIAMHHIGARFQMGAEGPRQFDCSGLIYSVYKEAGLLSRIGGQRRLAAGYYHWFKDRGLASRGNPKVGDLIIWTDNNGHIKHSGIYVGTGHAVSALINPWGVKRTHINTIHARFLAFLHVRLER